MERLATPSFCCIALLMGALASCGGDDSGGAAPCSQCADASVEAAPPASCGADTCNEPHGGGTCSDASGRAVCSCAQGYLGATCRQCAAGFHPDQGTCVKDSATACAAAAGGESGPVQAPVLRDTLPGSWDENWLGSPGVADLDVDGKNEIIATRHSVLYVWNADGSLKWQTAWGASASSSPEHGSTRMWASPVIGNFDADPQLEIAVGADADSESGTNVAVYDHAGELMPGWPAHFGGAHEVRSITAGDLDGDGNLEIVVNKTSDGPATAVYRLDGTMRAGWPQVDHATCDPPKPAEPCWDFGGYNQNIAVGDVDRDGFLDVVSSYDAIGFGIFDRDGRPFPTDESFADRVITAVEAYHDIALSRQGWGSGDRSEFTYSPPVIADIDGNGDLEIVLVGDHEHSESTDNRGVTFWVLNDDMTRPAGWEAPKDTGMPLINDDKGQNIVPTQPSPAVGNLDQDAGLEIVAPAYDGNLYAFGPKGALLWKYQFAAVASPYTGASEPVIADLNGDGHPEVVFATFSSGEPKAPEAPAHLIILSGNGVELHKVELSGRGSMAAPTVADLDGDGDLELIVSLKDSLGAGKGGVQIWDVAGSSANCLPWPTGRGNLLRQGRAQAQP